MTGRVGQTEGEFSVAQFFSDEEYEYVRRFVGAEEAVRAFRHYTNSVAAKMGMVQEVRLTDGGDATTMHWKRGEGIVFPLEMKGRDNHQQTKGNRP